MASFLKHTNNQLDLRGMLLKAGVGQYNAVLSIPYMNMLPGTTDPYAQGVMQMVKGLQRLLNKNGERVAVDGGLGETTVRAIIRYSGDRWFDKSWSQLYNDAIQNELWPGYRREDRGANPRQPDAALEGDRWDYARAELSDVVGDVLFSPVGLLAAGVAAYLLFFRKKTP